MNKKILTAAVILSTMGGLVDAAAETPVYTLDAVVVTANRTETKELDTNADVSVVTAKDIEQHHYKDVGDAIRNVPGVSLLQHGANGQNYSSDSIYLNGSNNVVLLIDGQRANTNGSTGASVPLGTQVNMNSIDRIEVLRGSASTLYGSDAQGGVINIITKKPADGEINSTVSASVGSYDGEKYNLYNEGSQNGFFWTVDAQKQLQGNFKDGWGNHVVNHLNAKSLAVSLGKDLGNESSLVFDYQKYKSDYSRPSTGSMDPTKIDGKRDNDHMGLRYKAKISDRLSNEFNAFRNRNTFLDGTWGMDMSTRGLSDQLTYKTDSHTLIGGIDYYKDKLDKYVDDPILTGKSISNTALYVQDIWNVTDKWNVTPGVRIDHHSEFGNHTSPSVTVGYKTNEDTNLYVSYKEFFVAPNLYQLYNGKGNPDLQPQEGSTIELGVHHQFDDTLYGAFNIYRQHAKNLIVYDHLGADYTAYYKNSGEADSWGWNIQLNKDFTKQVSASVGYTFTHVDAAAGKNENLNGVLPESQLNVNLDYHNATFNAYLAGRGVMNRLGPKGKGMDKYGDFWVWDAGVNYGIPQTGFTVFAKVNNIFDQFYTDVGSSSGFNYSAYEYWYSAPGRNYEVGVSFQF